jgi:hypothetical protein
MVQRRIQNIAQGSAIGVVAEVAGYDFVKDAGAETEPCKGLGQKINNVSQVD